MGLIVDPEVTTRLNGMDSKFPRMSDEAVRELRKRDPAVKAIQSLLGPMSFTWLRETFKQNNNLKNALQYGRAVLSDCALLDQYLYTYGNMIQSQWQHILGRVKVSDDEIRLIDYGCGQGLAGLIISDSLGTKFQSKVKEVILIEPSAVGLVRSEAVYRNLFPAASIVCLDLMFGDMERSWFTATPLKTLHVLSNVLDIAGFDQSHVFNSTLTTGQHAIMAVSHNRDFEGGAERIKAIKAEIEKAKYSSWVTVRDSATEEFHCGPNGKFAAISWIAELDIQRG